MKDTHISNIIRHRKHSGLDLQYPPWVAGEMATMAPSTVQLEHFCRESEDYKIWEE